MNGLLKAAAMVVAFLAVPVLRANDDAGPQRLRQRDGSCQGCPCMEQANAAAPAAPTTRPGMGRGGGGPAMGRGMARGPGMGRGMPQVMQLIHTLLDNHGKIQRDVQEIPGGVLTTTTSEDATVTKMIRTHVRQMVDRMEQGQPIRMWDPLFVELFRNYEKIHTQIENIDGGVRVTQTSDDPKVTLLIRQHAKRGVSEFVADGWDRVHEPTPLPESTAEIKAGN